VIRVTGFLMADFFSEIGRYSSYYHGPYQAVIPEGLSLQVEFLQNGFEAPETGGIYPGFIVF
jgi:hypothetical protein